MNKVKVGQVYTFVYIDLSFRDYFTRGKRYRVVATTEKVVSILDDFGKVFTWSIGHLQPSYHYWKLYGAPNKGIPSWM